MKKAIATYAAVLLVGIALGFSIGRRYCGASPKAVTTAVGSNLSAFGISETHAPLGQILALVWQAVENPLRRRWTTYSGPMYFPKTNSIGSLYSITNTNDIAQHELGLYQGYPHKLTLHERVIIAKEPHAEAFDNWKMLSETQAVRIVVEEMRDESPWASTMGQTLIDDTK